jgi:hypothetical protein
MNWADITDVNYSPDISLQKSNPLKFTNQSGLSYSNVVSNVKPEPKFNKTKPTNSQDSKGTKGRKYCYTCKPRGKVSKHIIEKSELKGVVFHFDLHKRPLILVTPIKHYETLYEMPKEEIPRMFEAIRVFCDEWNITDYQISFNNGEWQTHSHFHIKIKTSEKLVNRLRRDHFLRLKLQQNYE